MEVNHDSVASFRFESRQSMVQTSEETCGNESNTTGGCSNFDQTNCVCIFFQQSVGFQNIWLGYSLLVVFSLLISGIYSCLICCKLPQVKHFIKWDVGIFFC